ncbi:MAG: dockerin type I repeat-containing protein [Myxococcota bacterium]
MNRKRKVVAISTAIGAATGILSQASVAAADCANPSAAPSAAVVVLLDRSGSMYYNGQCRDGSVKRKWECGVNDAHDWIADNDPAKERVYFIWQFRTQSDPNVMTVQDNGTGNNGYCEDDAFAKLVPAGSLEGPLSDDASTPLSGAYCQAVEFLLKYRKDKNMPELPLYIKLESDGLENSTPNDLSITKCHGFDGGSANFAPAQYPNQPVINTSVTPPTADGLQIGSWQALMYDAAISGAAHPYPPLDPNAFKRPAGFPDPMQVITNVTFLDEFIQSTSALRVSALRSDGPDSFMTAGMSALSAASATAASTNNDLVNFFGAIARTSGARLTRFGSGAAPVPSDPYSFHKLKGDADDNGCVNSLDFNLVKSSYGQKAIAGNTNAIRADLNVDGIVNSADYLVLSANYGKGCSTSPGTVPVLGNALFGFEDVSKWSSSAPLAVTSTKHSEGSFSLKVGGSSWREIKSVNFNTSLFSGITSKVGLDVLIPSKVSNPAWLGQVLLFVSAPSAGINNQSLGTVELSGKPLNKFVNVQFNIPANVKTAMSTSRSDFSFKIAINANDANYEIDNLRFQ